MKKKFYIILSIILVITLIHLIFPPQIYQETSNGNHKTAIDIKEDDVFEEFFSTNLKNIDKIGIRLSTYQYRNTHGKISISLYGNDKLIKTKIIELKNVQDNTMVYLNFNKQKNSDKVNYKILIKYDEYFSDIKLATWLGSTGTDNNYVLINGERQVSSLYYTISGKGKVKDFILYDLLIICLIIIIYTAYGGQNEKNKK